MRKISFFSAQDFAREAYIDHSWVRSPPPQKECPLLGPPKINSWLQCHVAAKKVSLHTPFVKC